MSIIDELSRMLDGMNDEYLTVHEERCIGVRNRHANCLRCIEACAGGALSYVDGRLTVDVDKCIGCGSCATACPTSAIEIHRPSDAELVAELKGSIRATGGRPVIACETVLEQEGPGSEVAQAAEEGRVVSVPCLGRVDETVPLMAAAFGCLGLTLVHCRCAECEHGHGGELSERVCESARNLLEAFGSEMGLESVEEMPPAGGAEPGARAEGAADPAASQERPSDAAVPDVDDMAPGAYRKVGRNGTLSHKLPTRRTVMYNCLKHIGKPVADEVDQRVIGSVSIDTEACNSCRMCTVFCPTGALAKVDDDESGTFGVEHRSSACLQCRLCESICPTQALEVSSKVPIDQFMGEKAVFWEMEKPSWEANRPDSMFQKVHHVIGDELEMGVF